MMNLKYESVPLRLGMTLYRMFDSYFEVKRKNVFFFIYPVVSDSNG